MNQNYLVKKWRLAGLLLLFLVTIIFVYIYLNSFQYIDITFAQGVNAEVVLRRKDGNGIVAAKTSTNQKVKLKKGEYFAVITGNDYQEKTENILLEDKLYTLGIDPNLSSSKLAEILKKEESAIHAVIKKELGYTLESYVIESGTLYHHGEWYGAIITPQDKGRDSYDVYRLVTFKKDGKWELTSKPPELILSNKKYPGIPRDILIEVNKLTLLK